MNKKGLVGIVFVIVLLIGISFAAFILYQNFKPPTVATSIPTQEPVKESESAKAPEQAVASSEPETTIFAPEPRYCTDGTEYGTCSAIKPKYCEEGEIVDRANFCGCDEGYTISNQQCVKTIETEETIDEGCVKLFKNGAIDENINIYFYEDGFNSKPLIYDNYVLKFIAVVFGGTFGSQSFNGIEPFNTLKSEFNVFSYKDEGNSNDGECWPPSAECGYQQIAQKLEQECSGFAAPSDWGNEDGNYNIVVVPFDEEGWGSSSRSEKRIDLTTLRMASADIIYHNIKFPIASLAHEFGHKIGFFDEEYGYYDLYLGAKTYSPNIDSFSCTKWCEGVNKQSSCYGKYAQWLECFKDKFIEESDAIQGVLEDNDFDWQSTENYDWWGICFDAEHLNACGNKLQSIVDNKVRPTGWGGPSQIQDSAWLSNWESCKNLNSDLAGADGCDLGLNCGQNGCYVGASLSRFLPSREGEYLMGADYSEDTEFNKYDLEIMEDNILDKSRYVDVVYYE